MVTRYFTFGCADEKRHITIKITAENEEVCRDKMIEKFGYKWAFMYPTLKAVHPLSKKEIIELGVENSEK